MNAGDTTTVRVQIGQTLTITLGAGATLTLIELDGSGKPLTPVAISMTPTVLGPFNAVKTYLVRAVNGQASWTIGLPDHSLLAPRIIAQSAVQIVAPANTNENVLASITIPGGTMGPNGGLNVWALWGMTNNINVKTLRARLDGAAGTVYLQVAGTSLAQFSTLTKIFNRGAVNAQVGPGSAINGLGSSTSALVTSAVDTSVDTTIVLSGQKATSGDALTLEAYCIEVVPDFS